MLNFENLFYVSEHLYIKIPDIYLYANIIQILVKRINSYKIHYFIIILSESF